MALLPFTAGQAVNYRGMAMPATIISGPHRSPGAVRYLIEKADGNVSLVKAGELSVELSRREKIARAAYSAASAGEWERTNATARLCYLNIADAIIALDEKPLAVGDEIRILQSGHHGADVRKGDILTVTGLAGREVITNAPGQPFRKSWHFTRGHEGIGWERV